jgi:hypothetical protein
LAVLKRHRAPFSAIRSRSHTARAASPGPFFFHPWRQWLAAFGFVALSLTFAQSAEAEVDVTGSGDDLTLEVHAAMLPEVTAALAHQAGVTIEVVGSDPRPIDGTFHGSLRQVLADMLRNTSFVVSETVSDGRPTLRVTLFAAP